MLLLLLLSVSVLENVKMLHTHSQQQFYNSISLLQRHKHTYTCKNIVLCTSASSCVCIIYLLDFFLLFACLIQISCIEIIENILFMLSAFSFTFPLCCRSHWYMHRIYAATIRNVYGSPTMLLLLLLQRRIVIAVSIISLVFACQSIFTTHWTRFLFSAVFYCFYNRQIFRAYFLCGCLLFEFPSNCA